MLSRIGLSSTLAFTKASSPHGYQSTGLWACCNKYGLVSLIKRFVCLYSSGLDMFYPPFLNSHKTLYHSAHIHTILILYTPCLRRCRHLLASCGLASS